MYGHFQPAQRMATPMSSQPTRSLFVGDLSFFCTEVDLVEAFSCFGEILNCEIKRSRGGDSLMHGFVDFAREADACRAIQHMNGRKFMGRKLKVNWTNQKSSDFERESWVQVHVNFLCPNINVKITEEVLETIFVRFGNFADISVKRHLCSYQPHQTTGYAFVYFFDAHTALRAIYGLRSGPVNGIHFECCLSHKAEQMLREVQGMGAVIKRQQTGNPGAFFKKFEGKQQHHMPRRFQPAPVHQQFPSSSAHRSISPSFLQSQSHFDALPQSELFASTEFVSRSGSASPKSFSSADSLSTPTLSSESHLFDFARFQPERPSHLPSYTSTRPAHTPLEFLSFLEDPQQFSIDLF